MNAAGIVLLRSVLRTRWPVLTGVVAVTIGASIWVTSHQINLALFLVLPVTFAVIHRWDNGLLDRPRYWVLGLFVLALVSPLWWVVVLVLLLPVAVLPALVRRDWQRSGHTLWVWGALLLGMLGQAALFLTLGKGPGNDTTRQAWASNYSGGHLVDLAVGSPAAVEYLPRIGLLTEGASPDSGWGFTSCLAAAIALLAVLTVPPIRSRVGGTTVFPGRRHRCGHTVLVHGRTGEPAGGSRGASGGGLTCASVEPDAASPGPPRRHVGIRPAPALAGGLTITRRPTSHPRAADARALCHVRRRPCRQPHTPLPAGHVPGSSDDHLPQ